MAVLTGPNVVAAGGGSGAPRWAILSFQKVTAGDTFDLATLTAIPGFVSVTDAYFANESNRTSTRAVSTIAGTVVTIVGTGIAADDGQLYVLGA